MENEKGKMEMWSMAMKILRLLPFDPLLPKIRIL